MTTQPPLPAGDARQPDALDAFLDGLASGENDPPRGLDPTLGATVRHVHGLAHESFDSDLDRAGKARRWEDLMQRHDQNRIARSTVTPFSMTATLPSSSAPPPIPLRPVLRQSRLRRLGNQSLGLVATLTLVLLVAASSLAVYLTAPQRADEPTMMSAAFGATPTAAVAATASNPRVPTQPCDVVPRTFDEVMTVLARPLEDLTTPPDGSRLSLPLPDGSPVDAETVATLTQLTGIYVNCPSVLQLAALGTDDWIYRMFSTNATQVGFPENNDLNGEFIVQTWLHRDGIDIRGVEATSQPSTFVLGDLRQLDDGRIAGYLSRSYTSAADGTVTTGKEGYIAFAEVNGRWLIDDFRTAPLG